MLFRSHLSAGKPEIGQLRLPSIHQLLAEDAIFIEKGISNGRISLGSQTIQEACGQPSQPAVTEACELYIPLGELVDVEKELARLAKDLKNVEGEIARANGKLNNQGFVAKAPANLIQQEREKLVTNTQLLEKLKARIAEMESLR